MMMHEESWNAEKLLRTSGAYWESCTLHTAVALGIFSLLGNEYLEAEDLALEPGQLLAEGGDLLA